MKPALTTRIVLLGGLLFSAACAHSDQVRCIYNYGGAEGEIVARATTSPYTAPRSKLSNYFSFRIVFQTEPVDLAAINLYTYDERDNGPALVHQARYPYPPAQHANSPYGFTGLNFVYAAPSESELQYWCLLESST